MNQRWRHHRLALVPHGASTLAKRRFLSRLVYFVHLSLHLSMSLFYVLISFNEIEISLKGIGVFTSRGLLVFSAISDGTKS
jgi:hypothetical protein